MSIKKENEIIQMKCKKEKQISIVKRLRRDRKF